ncbi:hypothetical protein LJB86_02810 [Deltaproteobacteria bacterium OttesenSCG-928-M10]|nr:hypothetical protein [Deltaproteobacteria bacterium OttesenSCG-928-M10]
MTSRYMDEPYCYLRAQVNLHLPTNITSELIEAANEALDRFYQSGHGFMKGSIMLYELSDADHRQMTLIEWPSPRLRKRKEPSCGALWIRLMINMAVILSTF